MSTIPLSGVNSRFLAPSRFPAFHLKCPAFLRISSWKNALYAASSGSQTTRQPASSARQRDINDYETVYFVIIRSPFDRAMYLFVQFCVFLFFARLSPCSVYMAVKK